MPEGRYQVIHRIGIGKRSRGEFLLLRSPATARQITSVGRETLGSKSQEDNVKAFEDFKWGHMTFCMIPSSKPKSICSFGERTIALAN
jgi:hypothetical protein